MELLKCFDINKHLIDPKPDKQTLYKPIYSLRLIELKILKIYIKTNIANSFICSFKFLAKTLILFVQKLNNNLYLYMDYQTLNNLTIKN